MQPHCCSSTPFAVEAPGTSMHLPLLVTARVYVPPVAGSVAAEDGSTEMPMTAAGTTTASPAMIFFFTMRLSQPTGFQPSVPVRYFCGV
ncbi:hypothetical protein [Actinoplanes sp. URMC 104]|uniref:hypothetical protein n=1 Tax=Actinoplanes sp. URMC 104 TaxID=3423409 RepID=UPI003F1995BA